MLGKERGAVADADDAGMWQFLAHELVHFLLARLVECRRRFIEEDPVGLDEEDAGKGEALLLAEREDAAPVVDIIEARDKVRQADLAQDFLEVLLRARGTQRVVKGTAQAAERQVRPLRQERIRLFSGISISPLPYGQIPASVRRSVLLPQPEAPVIKRRSPSLMVRLQSASSTRPSGS